MSAATPVRVLIADDSRLSREVLKRIIESEPGMRVVAQASNGKEALELIQRQRPDVVLMDIMMPVMDGLTATRSLMRTVPTPTVLVSELMGRDADLNFKALESGALDVLRKLSSAELADPGARKRFLRHVRAMSQVPVVRRYERHAPAAPDPRSPAPQVRSSALIAIGASTGGPPAIATLLRGIDARRAPPIVIVQHMTEGFIDGMVKWLDDVCAEVPVQLVREGEQPLPGRVYVAPDDRHVTVGGGRLRLVRELGQHNHRPSIDGFFSSLAASAWASTTTAVLLTGMGADGARGMLELRHAGARTIAQDEASAVVYGMPRVAAELGAANEVLALDEIAARLQGTAVDRVAPTREAPARGIPTTWTDPAINHRR